ncbi:Hypothetical protein SMAX5B_006569 [Scophthalmus maximus]|uniref:Uncharacterized protein n=1 Tax=Scophthalmus maximus TaxID=52904 RepID=A0A2U9BK92_SCOMX|nr:Hypothetical protein SMAX5B_006569 [Scophthalmus maximus]
MDDLCVAQTVAALTPAAEAASADGDRSSSEPLDRGPVRTSSPCHSPLVPRPEPLDMVGHVGHLWTCST